MVPEGFLERMKKLLGSEYDAFLASYDRPLSAGLRMNPLKTDAPPDLSRFGISSVAWCPTGFYYDPQTRPGKHPWHEAGLYYLQEPSAMAPAVLLDAKPGETILDLCAAPGGKTTQIAGGMRGRGLLVSNEINPKRAQILAQNVERLGIANALVLSEHPANLAERFAGCFDGVLVDAPCSGEGMFRKEEAACTDWSEKTVEMCAARQREILRSAAAMVRPGGRLVYSTCTFSPEENEGTVLAFLKEHPEFRLEKAELPMASPARPDWTDSADPEIALAFRLWPHRLRGEGHFAALMRKEDGTEGGTETAAGRKLPAQAEEFRKQTQAAVPDGKPVLFGRRLFLAPESMPSIERLKVLRPGLELGELKRDRLEPAHAWALWLKECAQCADYSSEDRQIADYLAGESISSELSGWTLVRTDGLSLGWAKGSGGQLKNHYPKALRRR